MRAFAVQRVALGMERAQARQRVVDLQQRALGVVAQAAVQLLGRGAQVNHRAALAQVPPVGRPQHRATASGQHARRALRQLVDHSLLDVAKGRLALVVKVVADRAAQALLDHRVRIRERQLQPPRERAADGGFAAAGQADKNDQWHEKKSPDRPGRIAR